MVMSERHPPFQEPRPMPEPDAPEERVRIHGFETLADDWYVLRKYRLDYRRADGSWQRLSREAYDRGNGAAVLLYDRKRGSVFLTRQFRLPAFVNGHPDGMLLEVPAGLLDAQAPADAIRREVEEETGFRLARVEEVLSAYMSPGSVTERLHLFVAEVAPGDRVAAGGGDRGEGEDIEVVELPFAEALAAVAEGRIVDGKTIMLLYHAKLAGLVEG
jgi:GDP-mannose pyrophosphatase NudK